MLEQKSFVTTSQRGTLYLIPTPIGNLEDMTYRAVRLLQEVDLILAEDTRNTIKLLNHFAIETPMQSFHAHSSQDQVRRFIAILEAGQSIGLVSDAGMPLINDPGHPLVLEALAQSLNVVALPGANAALTGLIASGLDCRRFTYYGFFPRTTKEQIEVLNQVNQRLETALFYESPYRIKKSLKVITQHLGETQEVVVARELTKKYESYWRGSVSELLAWLADQEVKGECVLMLAGGGKQISQEQSILKIPTDPIELSQLVNELIEVEGLDSKQAIKQVAKTYGLKKQIVYQAYHQV